MSDVQIRDDIIKAAAQVFSEHGYDRATLADVAQLVGMRRPSLYHHIRSKEDLLFAIHERLADELIANTRAVLDTVEEPAEQLRLVMRVAMHLIADHQEEVTVFLREQKALAGERRQAVIQKRDAYQALVEQVVARGVRQGLFRDIPVAVTTLGVLGMVNWGYQWYRPGGSLSADQIADLFADLILNGVRQGE